jgi:predicted RNA binding protein YcfA (HicA-like mRNA interferase family)
MAAEFPSLTGRQLRQVLERKPLSYRTVRQRGSHRTMEAAGRPRVTFSFHDTQPVRPATVKRILCQQIGLSEDEARKLL